MGQMLADPEQVPGRTSVNIVFPVFEGGGTHVNISGIAMTKAAPNRAAALKFMEWLSSDAAQKIYAETNHEFPVKPGVERSALVASWGTFTPDDAAAVHHRGRTRRGAEDHGDGGFRRLSRRRPRPPRSRGAHPLRAPFSRHGASRAPDERPWSERTRHG
jgi:hypothetical protein